MRQCRLAKDVILLVRRRWWLVVLVLMALLPHSPRTTCTCRCCSLNELLEQGCDDRRMVLVGLFEASELEEEAAAASFLPLSTTMELPSPLLLLLHCSSSGAPELRLLLLLHCCLCCCCCCCCSELQQLNFSFASFNSCNRTKLSDANGGGCNRSAAR